jgi:3',5'-cyclic AMP phosphodiesterase CpdA
MRTSLLLAFAAFWPAALPAAAQERAPFDPKPLTEKLAERITTDRYRFAVLGDTKHAARFKEVVAHVAEKIRPDFVLTTGDMVRAGGGSSGKRYWEMLAEEAGEEMRRRPWWPAIGNHELSSGTDSGRDAFRRFYNLEREYYRFTFRNAAFIALPYPQPEDEQLQWLEEELKRFSKEGRHIFLFNHMPYYTVGKKSERSVPNKPTEVTRLFNAYGVRAVFSGHDHGYYRTVREGIPYVISAGGGATIYAAERAQAALPEDVYFYATTSEIRDRVEGSLPEGAESPKYVHYHGGRTPKETFFKDPKGLIVVVEVDGRSVKLVCTTTRDETLDEFTLAP